MKTITIYEAEDGTRFDLQLNCIGHENLIAGALIITDIIGKKLNIGDKEYQRHNIENVNVYKECVIKFAIRESKHFEDYMAKQDWKDSYVNVRGIVGRIISECCPVADKLWGRLMCIDSTGKEFNQPYYASNPSETVNHKEIKQ